MTVYSLIFLIKGSREAQSLLSLQNKIEKIENSNPSINVTVLVVRKCLFAHSACASFGLNAKSLGYYSNMSLNTRRAMCIFVFI